MDRLHALAEKPRRLVAGLLSGTSADAIDCAICSIDGCGPARDLRTGEPRKPALVRLEAFRSQPYDLALRSRILDVARANTREIAELHAALGDAFGEALHRTLVLSGVPEEALDLAGSHGQTVYHHSGAEPKVTLQLGEGDRIAARVGVPVFSDFRQRDVAEGGEGAPLSPYADLVLFPAGERGRRAVLNLGGVANVTVLDADPRQTVAFDTGPANAPLDRIARRITKGEWACDFDGQLAARGVVLPALLAELLQHPYLRRKPPKSTGTETFGDEFVNALAARQRIDHDVLATVTCFVAMSIAGALREHVPAGDPITEVIVAGGGVKNRALLRYLEELLAPATVLPSDQRGIPAKAREAIAFAILANDALFGLPTALRSVTGARRGATLGKLSLPPPTELRSP